MERNEVSTVFKITDAATGPLRQMSQSAEKLHASTEKAKKSTEAVGKTLPIGARSRREAPAAEPPAVARARFEGPSKEEKEQFVLDKEELKFRRMRMRHQKLHHAQNNVLERFGNLAMMGFIGEENKAAKFVGKTSSSAIAIGTSMTAFGGKMGAFGEVLGKLGGYGAMAGLALEGLAAIDEVTGGHLEKAGEAAKNWALHTIGILHTQKDLEDAEALEAKYLGYRSTADFKMAEATEKRWKQERALGSVVEKAAMGLEAKPITGDERAMDEYNEALIKKARDITKSTGVSFDVAMKSLEGASQHTAATVIARSNREAALSDIEQKVLLGMKALPYNANAEQVQAHNEEIQNTIAQLVKTRTALGGIEASEAEAVAQNLLAHESLQTVIEQRLSQANEEARLEDAVKQYAKLLPKIPVHATVDQMLKFNAAIAGLTAQAAGALGAAGIKMTPEMTKLFQQELTKKGRVTHMHFPHARFDIKQAFAEGFDPDRIATAFSNDLATLGERRLQSGFLPTPGMGVR